jgi:hypothetical protein
MNLKKLFSVILLIHFINNSTAQSVGIGTVTPNPSAVLDLQSSNKGLLLPRVADTTSIAGPVKGLTIYSTANNKIWFHNGNRWQQAASNAGGTDSIWYKSQDSIVYTAQKFVAINTDPAFLTAAPNLHVTGSVVVQGPQRYSTAAPTAAQTYTMDNTGTYFPIPPTDSVFKIYDPGNIANYNNNTQGNILVRSNSGEQGFKLKFDVADFGLAEGDTLWVGYATYPACRDNNIFFVTNTSIPPKDAVIASKKEFYFSFRSDNSLTDKGFAITVQRIYAGFTDDSQAAFSTVGSALYFKNGSFAAGYSANANGRGGSTALGINANATRAGAVAIGNNVTANGTDAVVLGVNAIAEGERSIALGDKSRAAGTSSLAFGPGAVSTGLSAVAMGNGTTAAGYFSFAAGLATTSKAYGGFAAGIYNDAGDFANAFVPDGADRIFQIGNGNDAFTKRNALTILRNGNVGIATVNPHAPLQFANTIANRKIVLWEAFNTELDYFGFGINSATLRYNVPAGSNHTFFAGSTTLFNLYSNGNATLLGSLTQLSDARLKKTIAPLHNTLTKLIRLSGYSYYWKDTGRSKEQQIGLLAQEVQQLFPQLVQQDKAGVLSVNYTGLIPVLIETVKELNIKLEMQQKKIDQLYKLLNK